MLTVYADYSGDRKDQNDNLILYCSVVIEDRTMVDIKERMLKIISELGDRGLKTHPKFEFHTDDIVNNKREWRNVPDNLRRKLKIYTLAELKKIFVDFKITTVVLVIDKENGGLSYLKQWRKLVNSVVDENMEKEIKLKLKNAGFEDNLDKIKGGPLSLLVGLLFGFTDRLMNEYGITEEANVIVDKQFVKHIKFLKAACILFKYIWQTSFDMGMLPTMTKYKSPRWHLSDSVIDIESYESFGVQLADFAAYMTRSLKDRKIEKYKPFSVLKNDMFLKVGQGLEIGHRY